MTSVAECAVVGRPDPEWGESVTAIVVPGEEVPSLEMLREVVKESLPAFCAPHSVEYVDQLPRTALGKIQRHLL